MTSVIPAELRGEIEHAARGRIVEEKPRGGGGASRQGAEVTLRMDDGTSRACYLTWDSRVGDPARRAYFDRETAALAALSGPLASSGVKVARLLASTPSHLALLSEFVNGDNLFGSAVDPAGLARDVMAQLAALHRVNPAHPSLAALGDAACPPSVAIRERVAQLRAENLASSPEPIIQLMAAWLAGNVPADSGSPVVLHGDFGPGNFLHDGHRVTTLVDWEFAHLGDPMEDLAQIWVRSLIQPFVPMAEVFAAYEAAGGARVDLARVKYHRLYFQLGFSVPGHAAQYAPDAPPSAAIGTTLMYNTMHKRIIVSSLAELCGQTLATPALPDCAADWADRTFATALNDLRDEIVPGLASQRAASKAKALARLVKFWRMRDRYGRAFEADELAEIAALIGPVDLPLTAARAQFAHAIAQGQVDRAAALQACHNRMVRETFLMADAMGALATTTYEKLD